MKHYSFLVFEYISILLLVLLIFAISFDKTLIAVDMPVAVDSRRQTFVYSPNEIFEVKGHIEYKTFLQLPEDEFVTDFKLGDSYSWAITHDDSYPNILIMQPIQKGVRTNFIVFTTKKRVYVFDLISKENADYDIAYSINFYYPETESENFDNMHGDLTILPEDKDYEALVKNFDLKDADYDYSKSRRVSDDFKNDAKRGKSNIINNDNRLNSDLSLNFSYDIAGDKSISPFEIFDNGMVTFFKFPLNDKNLPKIFIVQEDGSQKSIKMVLYKEYVLIDGVYKKMILRLANRKVYIRNNRVDIKGNG